jgi:hypothetical protein
MILIFENTNAGKKTERLNFACLLLLEKRSS